MLKMVCTVQRILLLSICDCAPSALVYTLLLGTDTPRSEMNYECAAVEQWHNSRVIFGASCRGRNMGWFRAAAMRPG
jgi:hypothetical protein